MNAMPSVIEFVSPALRLSVTFWLKRLAGAVIKSPVLLFKPAVILLTSMSGSRLRLAASGVAVRSKAWAMRSAVPLSVIGPMKGSVVL